MPSPRTSSFSADAAGWVVARPFGIELRIHPTWVFSLVLLSVSAYTWFVQHLAPGASKVVSVLLCVVFALAIVSCIVLHELSHSLMARGHGLPVRSITLFALGGVSQIEAEAAGPGAEYRIALAGPLMSILIATVCAGIARVLHPNGSLGAWGGIAVINLILAIFNLFPAFPMDGGRILRSALWARIHDRARATRWAAVAGRAVAALIIGAGFVQLILAGTRRGGDAAFGVYGMVIGFFIYNATDSASRIEGAEVPNQGRQVTP